VSQDLDSGICAIRIVRHAELSADIVCSRRGVVSSKNNVGKVPPLLGHIQNEASRFEVCLRNSEVEYCLLSRQSDRDGGIDTLLCRGRSGKHCQHREGGEIHCESSMRRSPLTKGNKTIEETISAYMESVAHLELLPYLSST